MLGLSFEALIGVIRETCEVVMKDNRRENAQSERKRTNHEVTFEMLAEETTAIYEHASVRLRKTDWKTTTSGLSVIYATFEIE